MENSGKILQNQEFDDNELYLFSDTFDATYKHCTLSLCLSMVYPNPATEKWRILAFIIYFIVAFPTHYIFLGDMINSWNAEDYNSALSLVITYGPFFIIYGKALIMFIYRAEAEVILKEVSKDYSKVRHELSEPYKRIANKWVKYNLLYEKYWTLYVIIAAFSFPVVALIKMVHSTIFLEPTRYMSVEVKLPFKTDEPDLRFESPYFEIMFSQSVLCCVMYVFSYTGYDSFVIITTNHACLKLELCGQAMCDAIKVQDKEQRWSLVKKVVDQHNETLRYIKLVINTHISWVTIICIYVSLHLCTCAVRLSELTGFVDDMQFMLATIAATLYIFVMCLSSTLLQETAHQLSVDFFCCGWENVQDIRITKALTFMIAKAQVPVRFVVMSIYEVNMDMFVKFIKIAYSMFTLVQQK